MCVRVRERESLRRSLCIHRGCAFCSFFSRVAGVCTYILIDRFTYDIYTVICSAGEGRIFYFVMQKVVKLDGYLP